MVSPLDGIKILDLARMGPGPFCTMLLGDLGAEIIKIEQAGFGIVPLPIDAESWAAYYSTDRNKKSIILDFKFEEARRIFYRMAESADAVIEGYRPGVAKKLGLDYDSVRRINSRIVYCSISGYGQDGPYRDYPGHDPNYIALAGAYSALAIRDGRAAVPLNLVADYAGGGLQAAFAVTTALLSRERTGKGQYVDVAMVDGVVSFLTWEASLYFASKVTPRWGDTPLTGQVPCGGVYEAKDGFVSLGCFEAKFWENLCRELGREDLLPYQYATGENKKWVDSELTAIFKTRTKGEWFSLLGPKDVPITPVNEFDEVFSDPHIVRRMVVELDHPRLGKVKQVGIPTKFSDTPGEIRSFSPLPGQHTDEVLQDFGYSKDEIRRFRDLGAVS